MKKRLKLSLGKEVISNFQSEEHENLRTAKGGTGTGNESLVPFCGTDFVECSAPNSTCFKCSIRPCGVTGPTEGC